MHRGLSIIDSVCAGSWDILGCFEVVEKRTECYALLYNICSKLEPGREKRYSPLGSV